MAQATEILSLVTTVGSEDDARRLATALLERRLAACVQLDRIESRYRWGGEPCVDAEVRLTVKSTPARLDDLQAFFGAEHPYELPQLVWRLENASAAYAAWVGAEVGAAG